MNRLLLSCAALMAMAAPLAAQAAPCRDAHGRFVSCTAAHRTEARRPAAVPHRVEARRPVEVAHRPEVKVDHRPMARVAPKRCRIGNRFASCSAPGAHPA